jgi:hypothetical protein
MTRTKSVESIICRRRRPPVAAQGSALGPTDNVYMSLPPKWFANSFNTLANTFGVIASMATVTQAAALGCNWRTPSASDPLSSSKADAMDQIGKSRIGSDIVEARIAIDPDH